MKRPLPPNNLPSAVRLALFLMVNFLLTPPGGKEVHSPKFTACFSSSEVAPFPLYQEW